MNKVYCVSYELRKEGQNYAGLYKKLKSYKWWHHISSTWLISTNKTVNEVCQDLFDCIDQNDLLLVIEVKASYQGKLPREAWLWIKANISKK